MSNTMSTAPLHLLTDPALRDIRKWNKWRAENPHVGVNLSYANLSYADLSYADLSYANLFDADLSYADLSYANLRYADLRYADLRYADLRYANLFDANLRYANLSYADLRYADLRYADLRGALGACRRDISSAVPVGSGQLCSAYFNRDTKTVTIWGGCETFNSFAACHARIVVLGGEYQKARLAWLKWVSVSLTGKKLKFWLDTANTND